MAKKPIWVEGTPKGDVRVETPDGVTRTFGDSVRNNLTDASYVSGPLPYNCGHGAFPNEGSMFDCGDNQPTMRKPINE